MSATVPPTPMCDRLASVSAKRETILRFLEWAGERGIVLAEVLDGPAGRSLVYPGSGIDLVFQHLGIDVAELDRERRALIASAKDQESAS